MGARRSPRVKLDENGNVVPRIVHTHLTRDEKARIARWVANDVSPSLIAKRLRRNLSTIYRFLRSHESTDEYGKLILKANVDTLVERVVEQANVDQSMEVLDRLGVLEKRQRDSGVKGPSVVVAVGMPGQPAMIAPTQQEMDDAIDVTPAALPEPEGAILTAPTTREMQTEAK